MALHRFLGGGDEATSSTSSSSSSSSSSSFQPDGALALSLAGIATFISLCISLYCIYKHLTNYSVPRIQRYIVRILFVSPVYALGSLFSLRFSTASVGLETVRDIMEAFVIYSFLALVLEYAGGDAACVNKIKNEPPLTHFFPLCCLGPMPRDGRFLRVCKQGTLQFVFIKPVMALVSLAMMSKGLFWSSGYQSTLLVIYNLSYSIALYCLALFYLGTKDILRPYSPVAKFLAVKAVVFATYWQSLLLLLWAGTQRASAWNNFILCIEMVPFAICLGLAFSHKQYRQGVLPDNIDVLHNMKEVLSVRDVVADAYHNFMPTYTDYTLHRPDGTARDGPQRKYRARTFLAGNIDSLRLREHDALEEEEEEEEEIELGSMDDRGRLGSDESKEEGKGGGGGGRKITYSSSSSSSTAPHPKRITFVSSGGGKRGVGGGGGGGGAALPPSPSSSSPLGRRRDVEEEEEEMNELELGR